MLVKGRPGRIAGDAHKLPLLLWIPPRPNTWHTNVTNRHRLRSFCGKRRVLRCGLVIAKFHYTDPTGPARTQRSFAAKKSPRGSVRVRSGPCRVRVVEFSYKWVCLRPAAMGWTYWAWPAAAAAAAATASCASCCLGLTTFVLVLANSRRRVCGRSGSKRIPCRRVNIIAQSRYDTIRDAALTCAQSWVSLIYRTEPKTKKWGKRKNTSSEVSVKSQGNPWSQCWMESVTRIYHKVYIHVYRRVET